MVVGTWVDHPQALPGVGLDALGRAQLLDPVLELAVALLLVGQLLAQLALVVAVSNLLDLPPDREDEHGNEQQADEHRAPQLPMALRVDLPHDRVVADVLLDGVLECLAGHDASPPRHSTRSAARSLALRARGFRSTSASAGTTGRFVSTFRPPPACSDRSVCFTMRSSSE